MLYVQVQLICYTFNTLIFRGFSGNSIVPVNKFNKSFTYELMKGTMCEQGHVIDFLDMTSQSFVFASHISCTIVTLFLAVMYAMLVSVGLVGLLWLLLCGCCSVVVDRERTAWMKGTAKNCSTNIILVELVSWYHGEYHMMF